MKTFTLKNKFQTNATLVANDFIDHYMVQANGEFVNDCRLSEQHRK